MPESENPSKTRKPRHRLHPMRDEIEKTVEEIILRHRKELANPPSWHATLYLAITATQTACRRLCDKRATRHGLLTIAFGAHPVDVQTEDSSPTCRKAPEMTEQKELVTVEDLAEYEIYEATITRQSDTIKSQAKRIEQLVKLLGATADGLAELADEMKGTEL